MPNTQNPDRNQNKTGANQQMGNNKQQQGELPAGSNQNPGIKKNDANKDANKNGAKPSDSRSGENAKR